MIKKFGRLGLPWFIVSESLARENGVARSKSIIRQECSSRLPGQTWARYYILVGQPKRVGSVPVVAPVLNADWCAAAVDALQARKESKDRLGARYDAPRIVQSGTWSVVREILLGVLCPLDTTCPPSLLSYRAPISQYPDTIASSTSSSRCEALGSALRHLKLHSPRGPEWAYFRCRCI
jgi:hypothetical protein